MFTCIAIFREPGDEVAACRQLLRTRANNTPFLGYLLNSSCSARDRVPIYGIFQGQPTLIFQASETAPATERNMPKDPSLMEVRAISLSPSAAQALVEEEGFEALEPYHVTATVPILPGLLEEELRC